MVLDALVPQMAERLLEVPKIIPQDRIQQQTVEQFVDSSEAMRANLAEAEKSLAALMTSQAVSKSSHTQVASDHEASVKVFAEELKAWTEATQVLQSETDGFDGHTYSLFQENPNAALQTSTDLKGFDMMTAVRQLAEQEHSTALARLASRISAITKFGADADNDPFVKEKDLIMDFSRLHAEASPETSQKSHCDEEASKATEMKEDLGAEVAKHSSELLSVAYKNAVSTVDVRRGASSPALNRRRNHTVRNSWPHMRQSTSRKWKISSGRSVKASLLSWTRNSSDRLAPMSRRRFTTR